MIKLSRINRGLSNLIRYLLKEYPKGIDFSLRDKKTSTSDNHGYALTSKEALKNILKDINIKGKHFLDIGSGKGGVICYAYELGAAYCTGIEYEEKWHKRAEKNISLLNYNKQVKSINIDARDFNSYKDFDIYFFFNPFKSSIFNNVVNKILDENLNNDKKKYIIDYTSGNRDILKISNRLKLIKDEKCPFRENQILIYEIVF